VGTKAKFICGKCGNDLCEEHTLLNGRNFQLGDVVWFGQKAVIIKITKTEGSNNAEVLVRITKKWYSREEIS
jgi:hypothetical protein